MMSLKALSFCRTYSSMANKIIEIQFIHIASVIIIMGCKSSISMVASPTKVQPQGQIVNKSISIGVLKHTFKKTYLKEALLFGDLGPARYILNFDPQTLKLKVQASASKTTVRKHVPKSIQPKYQNNLQQIIEQSMEEEFNPIDLVPSSFMGVVFHQQKCYLTGGVDNERTQIYPRCFVYTKSLFKRLPNMKSRRALHSSCVLQNHLYVIGGKTQLDDSSTAQCQRLDLNKMEWSKIPPMKIERSSSSCFVFKKQIYVLGGYNGQSRVKHIQIFDPVTMQWRMWDFQLHRGIECAQATSINENELLLVGGNIDNGPLRSCLQINLHQKKYMFHSRFTQPRLFHNLIESQKGLIILGGDNLKTCEVFDIELGQWSQFELESQKLSELDSEGLSLAKQTLIVKEKDQEDQVGSLDENQDYVFLFGNQDQPFIFKLNLTSQEGEFQSVPLLLPLCSFMGSCRMTCSKIVLGGGLNDDGYSAELFLYDVQKSTVQKLISLPNPCMLASFTLYNGYVYLSGGVGADHQPSKSFFRIKSDFSGDWQKLQDLPTQRLKHSTRILPPLIYFDSDGQQTDVFNTITQQFIEPQVGPSGSLLRSIKAKDNLYVFGGRELLVKYDCLGNRGELSVKLREVVSKLKVLGDPSLFSYSFVI